MTAVILFNILLLTLIFTAGSGGALLIRKRLVHGNENVMCVVWIAVLLTAVIPLYSSHAIITFKISDITGEAEPLSDTGVRTQAGTYGQEITDGYISDARGDIAFANKLYGGNNGGTASNSKTAIDSAHLDIALSIAAVILLCLWAGGVAYAEAKALLDYIAAKKLMYGNSQPYSRGRIANIFDECRASLGIKRSISIRIVREGFSCSPCVVGIFKPSIFMGGECQHYSDSQLRFIFMHELCHVKRHDLLFKLFALTVTSLHWFNPVSYIVYRAITEDCELACDNTVLSLLGRQHSDSYMFTILDIAERLCSSKQPALANKLGGGLFMSGSSGKRFLERRYKNMKFVKKSKFAIVSAVLLILTSLTVNTVVMSSCGMPVSGGSAATSSGSTGNIFLDEAIRGYYDLTNNDKVTAEMIEGIETLTIKASDYTSVSGVTDGSVILAEYTVNGKEILPFPNVIAAERFEVNYLEPMTEYYNAQNRSESMKKLNAFYVLKDYNDPTLTDDERAEMLSNSPFVTDYPHGCYIFDPYSSEREIEYISSCYAEADMYANYSLLGGYFDASALNSLPNLKSVTYMGITPVNEALPSGCTSEYIEYTYNDISFSGIAQGTRTTETAQTDGEPQYGDSKGATGTIMWKGEPVTCDLAYGQYEVEPKGINTVDGIEAVNLNCKALEAAIMEYYVMPFRSTITPEHLAEITSIEAVIRTDLDYLFDESLELHGGHYIEFTINGVKAGILPTYYNKDEFLTGKASDSLYVNGFYELVDDGENSYYKLIERDEADIAVQFKELAYYNGVKSLITGCWDEDGDGEATFIAEMRISDCMAARYVNGIPLAKAEFELDRQYFPNLQTFTFETK